MSVDVSVLDLYQLKHLQHSPRSVVNTYDVISKVLLTYTGFIK